MSYLQNGADSSAAVEHFPMRYWTGSEIEPLVQRVTRASGVEVALGKKYDRSLLVGRHVDTGEYNPALTPLRRLVNCLHEDYRRTELDRLYVEDAIVANHPDAQTVACLQELIHSWNILVRYTQQRLQDNISLIEMAGWADFSKPLQFSLMTVDRVINNNEWMWFGDARANVIESQLGYALRSLEHNLQHGLGCGHGLLVVLQVVK